MKILNKVGADLKIAILFIFVFMTNLLGAYHWGGKTISNSVSSTFGVVLVSDGRFSQTLDLTYNFNPLTIGIKGYDNFETLSVGAEIDFFIGYIINDFELTVGAGGSNIYNDVAGYDVLVLHYAIRYYPFDFLFIALDHHIYANNDHTNVVSFTVGFTFTNDDPSWF